MRDFLNEFVDTDFWTWQTGIPVSFIVALAATYIVYSYKSRLAIAVSSGIISLCLTYGYIWLIILNRVYLQSDPLAIENQRHVTMGFAISIIAGLITWFVLCLAKKPAQGLIFFLATIIFGGVSLSVAFYSSKFLRDYMLNGIALLGIPAIIVCAVIAIIWKDKNRLTSLTILGYSTFTSLIILNYMAFPTNRSYANLLPLVMGPYVTAIATAKYYRGNAIWIGSIILLFAVTMFQLIWFKFPLDEALKDLDLIRVAFVHIFSGSLFICYYLWCLYKNGSRDIKNRHPLLAIAAVLLNVFWAYPVILNHDLPWILTLIAINTLIGMIVFITRWSFMKVNSREFRYGKSNWHRSGYN